MVKQTRVGSELVLSGGWLRLAQAFWIALVLMAVIVFAGGAPLEFERLRHATVDFGLSSDAYALYLGAVDALLLLGAIAVGALILTRKANDVVALTSSLELVLLAVRATTERFAFSNAYPQWGWMVTVILYVGIAILPLVFAFFPDNQFFPRWTLWYVLFGFVYALFVVTSAIGLSAVRFVGDILFIGVGIVAQILRYRLHATRRAQQQTKWVVFGITLAFFAYFLAMLPQIVFPAWGTVPILAARYTLVQSTIALLGLLMVPITLAISILRSQLWDIDILIRRTVTYSLVTALLLGVYFFSIVILQRVFALVMGGAQNEIITVLSTLAIAALFVPLRNRIQAVIDKHFNRSRYNAQQVLQKFALTVRDETDLEKLSAELLNVVNETMQPKSVSLWLKEEKGKGPR